MRYLHEQEVPTGHKTQKSELPISTLPRTELMQRLVEHGFRSEWFREFVPATLAEFELSPMFPRFHSALRDTLSTMDQGGISARTMDIVHRSLAIGIALSQGNEAPFNNPLDDPRIRGKQIDPETGQHLAYSHHLIECLDEYAPYGRRESLLALMSLHDSIEDFQLSRPDFRMQDELLLAEIATEFADIPHLATLLRSVTIPQVTAEDRHIILSSRLAERIHYEAKRSGKPYNPDDINRRIVKVGITFGQIFLTDRQATNNDVEYLDLARQSIAMKCIDASRNMDSGSIKKPSTVRNAILIRMARIMGWQMADSMMDQLTLLDTDDPFNPGESYQNLQSELYAGSTIESCFHLKTLLEQEGIHCWIEPRYQISLQDESENTQCLQYYITVQNPDLFYQACQTIACISKKHRTLRNAKRDGFVHAQQVDGVVHDVMRFYGRKTRMYGLYNRNGIESYVRLVTSEPFPVNSIYLPNFQDTIYPEDALFYLPEDATLDDVLEMVYRLYATSPEDFPTIDRSSLL